MSGQPSSAPLSPSSHHWRRVANPAMQVIPIHSLTSRLGVRATIDTIQCWPSASDRCGPIPAHPPAPGGDIIDSLLGQKVKESHTIRADQ